MYEFEIEEAVKESIHYLNALNGEHESDYEAFFYAQALDFYVAWNTAPTETDFEGLN